MIGETFKRQMKSRRLFFAFSMRESINIRPTEDNYGLSIIFVCVSFTEDFIQTRIKTTSWSLHLNCPRCEDWRMCEIDLLQNPFQRTLQIIKECIPASGTSHAGIYKLLHPTILDGRTWVNLGEHGEHGKDGKHQPDGLKHSIWIFDT